jgi:hypothetical protein
MSGFFKGIVSTEYFYECINDRKNQYPEYDLFASKGIYPFVKYEKELELLNEYCFNTIEIFSKKLKDSKQKLEMQKLEKVEPLTEGYGHFSSYEYEESLQGILWDMQWLFDTVTAAQLIILLYSFFETRIREIYTWFVKDKIIKDAIYNKKTAKIDMYLKSFQTTSCHQIELVDLIMFFKPVREIRNLFVHEQWDDLAQYLSKIKLYEIIGKISTALYVIEDIYMKNNQQ